MPRNRSRSIQLHVRVNEKEKALIDRKMAQAGFQNINSYMRKMAIDGYVIRMDMSEIHEMVALLRNVSSNVNQIARRVNETHTVYTEDVEDVRHGFMELWKSLNLLLSKWEGI